MRRLAHERIACKRALGVAVTVLGLLGACDGKGGEQGSAAAAASGAVTSGPGAKTATGPAAPIPAAPTPATASAQAAPSPGALSPEAHKGRRLYAIYCLRCHGSDGKGSGPMAAMLGHVGNLTDPALDQKLPPPAMIELLKAGKGKMPAFGPVLSADQLNDVVAFVRTFRP